MNTLLNWLEKKLQTDIRYVLNGTSWLLLNQIAAFLFSFGFLWLFANTLSKEVYGEYRFITTVASVLALTTLPGMALSLTRSVALGHTATLSRVIKEKQRWGLTGSVLALIGASYYFIQSDTRLGTLFVLVALATPFIETYVSYTHYLNGLQDFKRYAIFRTIQRFFVVATTGAVVFYTQDIILIVTTFLVSTIICDRLLLAWARKTHPENGSVDESAINYGKHLSVTSAIRLGSQYLDKIALWYFAGPVQVAVYAVAMAMPQELVTGTAQISKLALPKMSSRSQSEMQHALLRKTAIYLLAVIPLAAGYALLAPYIFNVFFPQYLESILFSQIAAALILFAPSGLLLQYFVATENKKVQYFISVFEPIIQIGLYVLLIPLFGILGAVIAVLSRHTVVFGLLITFFLRDKLQLYR